MFPRYVLNTYEYDDTMFQGPPRNIPRDEVFNLFGRFICNIIIYKYKFIFNISIYKYKFTWDDTNTDSSVKNAYLLQDLFFFHFLFENYVDLLFNFGLFQNYFIHRE